jgi:hypothetical protein
VQGLEDSRSALAAASADGGAEELRAALLHAAATGVPGAVPLPNAADADALRAQAAAVAAELDRRRAAAAAAEDATGRIRAVVGDDFRALGRVTPPREEELRASLADSAHLQAGDPLDAVTWFERAAHVREPVARLERTLLYAEALRSPERLSLQVAQLPHRPAARWTALAASAEEPLVAGSVSLVVQASSLPPAGKPLVGLLVDEWTEVVP